MRRYQWQKIWFYILVGLMAIGVLNLMIKNPTGVLIPVLVLGGVFLLYKYPPQRWKMNARGFLRGTMQSPKDKRNMKKAKFRVIPGTKRDHDDNGDLPKYH